MLICGHDKTREITTGFALTFGTCDVKCTHFCSESALIYETTDSKISALLRTFVLFVGDFTK